MTMILRIKIRIRKTPVADKMIHDNEDKDKDKDKENLCCRCGG